MQSDAHRLNVQTGFLPPICLALNECSFFMLIKGVKDMKKCIREKCEYWKDINEFVSYCPLPRCIKVNGWIADKKEKEGERVKHHEQTDS